MRTADKRLSLGSALRAVGSRASQCIADTDAAGLGEATVVVAGWMLKRGINVRGVVG